MTEDFYNPQDPNQEHLCEGQPEPCYVEPPTIYNLLIRLPELWTDASCNQLSTSRLVLFMCGCCTVALTWAAIFQGKLSEVTSLIMAVAGTAAGVYFGSQFKDLRWKRREKD